MPIEFLKFKGTSHIHVLLRLELFEWWSFFSTQTL